MMNEYEIAFCKGSNGGEAIYISDSYGGNRVFGKKCWGNVETIASFPLTPENIDDAILKLILMKKEIIEDRLR